MKIIENHPDYYLWVKNNFNKLYQKKITILFIILMIFTVYSLSLLYYGMKLQKIQVAATLQQIIYDGAATRLNMIPNYFKGLFSDPDEFIIDLNFKDSQKLEYIRDIALKRGMIIEQDKNLEVDARLTLLGKKYKVKLSPTGQNFDMIGDPNKYAYKVTVKDGDRIYGMKEFKLIPPKARHHIVEWIGHKIENNEGLISLRYDFIQVTINGDYKGIYAIEEHFNIELLENNHFREGLMFSLSNDNKIIVFNEKKVISDKNLENQLQLLHAKWQAFLNGDLEVSKVLDIEKYAKFYAIADLMNSYHVTIKMNLKMYLNPVTNLIEPIAREYNSLRYSDGPSNQPLMIERVDKTTKNDDNFLFYALYDDTTFIKLYLNNLVRFAKKEYLDNFFEENEKQINDKLNIIYKEEPYYAFPKEYLYLRQGYIKNILKIKPQVKSYYNTDVLGSLEVQIKNETNFPIELLEINSSGETLYKFNDCIIINDLDYVVDRIEYAANVYYNLKYRPIGLVNYQKESIIIPKSFKREVIFSNLSILIDSNILNNPYLTVNKSRNTITFDKSELILDDILVIPKNYRVIGKPGLKINLINNSSILSYSPIEFIGSRENPILIYSTDSTGQGITIMKAENQSIFENVLFSNITNPQNSGWQLPGAITIYESKVKFSNTGFTNNHSEDYLNIIRSKYDIYRCSFENTYSDAFDGDFSEGLISNSTFSNCGNDAIDISGGYLIIDSVFIDNASDKGISVGESGTLNGKNITIYNSEIGITSKDLSIVELINVTLSNTKIGFTAYQKKSEYGPGKIKVDKYEINNINVPFLIEIGSSMFANGNKIATTDKKVEKMLYGSIYGKSSK